ncbi:hypothetical protein ASE90_16735 [Sphingomonas sp. Leaf67]|nr:hypothetical protein ASE90_16735 [Sphingomonas sp. Leaf67]
MLARIPQVSSAFNAVPTLPTNDPGLSSIIPNIRSIPAGGATTLVLLNGHRIGGSGGFAGVDPDIIPAEVLERVDVVPDGGSSIYGSDAIGGVINLITRKRFDGLQFHAKYGFGDGYHTLDANGTAGTDWGSGSAYVSYTYAVTGEIQGRERSYYRQFSENRGFCAPGTVQVTRNGTTTNYALPDRRPGTLTNCDGTDNTTIFPRLSRHSVFANLSQSLGSGLDVGVTAFYTRRDSTSHIDLNDPQNAQTGTITPANPFYVPIAPDPGTQSVLFSYAGVLPDDRLNRLDQYGITPTITADIGGGWQVRALGTLGESWVNSYEPQYNTTAQNAALAAVTRDTALNPYDLGATSQAVLDSIYVRGRTRYNQAYRNARAIIDGSPLSLPGGNVRLAAGVEYGHERLVASLRGLANGAASGSRDITSVYGEVAVPLFGRSNAISGFQSLVFSASGRYDHYSDFGGTFNPKFGATWEIVRGFKLRGNWGKAFNAPQLGDTTAAADTRVVLIPANPFYDPTDTTTPQLQARPSAIIAGGNPNLRPQTARTWSIGADLQPAPVPGLTLSATYYSIHLDNQVAIVPIFTPAQAYRPVYSPWVIKNPSIAQATGLFGSLPLVNFSTVAEWYNLNPLGPAVILDARRQNFGVYEQDGIDFNIAYNRTTGFGSVNAAFAGTYTLTRRVAALPNDPFSDLLESPGLSRFSFISTAGATYGDLTGSLTLSHSGGYDLNPGLPPQTSVDAFNTVDLFLSYDVNGAGLTKDLQLTAYIGNMFDSDPPNYNGFPGYANGATVGRVVQFGITKKF